MVFITESTFLIDQISYLNFNLLNGYEEFFQRIRILEVGSYLSSHSSLLDHLIYFGIINFLLYFHL